jgi:hypothetical protein
MKLSMAVCALLLPAAAASQLRARVLPQPAEVSSAANLVVQMVDSENATVSQQQLMLDKELELADGSQFGQDQWVLNQYRNMPGKSGSPYFLDIGAYDGVKGSNTHLLEQRGWHGACVEPVPKDFSMRTCQMVEKVVFDGSDVSFRVCGRLEQLSGVKNQSSKWQNAQQECPLQTFHSIKVSQLLANINAPKVLDYVSLDVEGAEMTVLNDWPAQHCARIWTIEHNFEPGKQGQIKNWLLSRGCKVKANFVDYWATCPC